MTKSTIRTQFVDPSASVLFDGHSPFFLLGSAFFALAVVYRARCAPRCNSNRHASRSVTESKECGARVSAKKVRQELILQRDLRGQSFGVVLFGIWVHRILARRGLRAFVVLPFRGEFPS